jgi:Fe-S cluster assembly scaffold IscU
MAISLTLFLKTMSYSQKLLDHYENPRNVGSLNEQAKNVGTGLVGAPACGDVMQLQIEVDEKSQKIIDAKFKTFGCGSAIASSSLATEWLIGQDLKQAAVTITNKKISQELSLPPVKIHCSLLAEEAIQAAIADYNKKNSISSTDKKE